MNLFPTVADLAKSGFIFRITDNGGESADRFSVYTCDGDYFAMSETPFHPQGVGMTGEGFDPQVPADHVEAGTERDLRWIDLPADCQRCVFDGLNRGFADYIESASAAASRGEARKWEGMWKDPHEGYRNGAWQSRTPIYCDGDGFNIRDDDAGYPNASTATDPGPFATFADAVRYMLPQDHDIAGEEYQGTRDIWNEVGGPAPLWNRDEEPPIIDADSEYARAAIMLDKGGDQQELVGWFAHLTDAENFLAHSATIDPDHLVEGRYTIDDLDHPDAERD